MDALKTLNPQPRLTILITDSCGTQLPPAQAAIAPAAAAPPTDLLFYLLFQSRGTIDMNSAAPGKEAFYWPVNSPKGGGFLTRAFWNTSVYGKGASWLDFFNQVDQTARRTGNPPACLFNSAGPPVEKSLPESGLSGTQLATSLPGLTAPVGVPAVFPQ